MWHNVQTSQHPFTSYWTENEFSSGVVWQTGNVFHAIAWPHLFEDGNFDRAVFGDFSTQEEAKLWVESQIRPRSENGETNLPAIQDSPANINPPAIPFPGTETCEWEGFPYYQ